LEFVNQSVVADWGNMRTYIVSDVDFTQNPVSNTFEYNGTQKRLAEYFQEVYGKEVRDVNQPLFKIKIANDFIYIPPEFTLVDGVPDAIRASPAMRDALKETRITPDQKMAKIEQMCKLLFEQDSFEKWGIKIDSLPISIQNTVLGAPQIFSNNQIIHCSEDVLRRQPVQRAVNLSHGEWIMFYQNPQRTKGRSNYNAANNVIKTLQEASVRLKVTIDEPVYIELENEGDKKEIEQAILNYMMASQRAQFRHPICAVFVLGSERNYPAIKEVMINYNIPTQVVTVRNALKFNMSKGTNIIKQIEAKTGAELYQLKFPDSLDDKRAMLIGVDVCHSGPNSGVGFVATTNTTLSQYYSEYFIQKKGQEIVSKNMVGALQRAIDAYGERNQGVYPSHFIIYRDGVGENQRETVIQQEVIQFKQAILNYYADADEKPQITLIFVNKRINQRFFVKDNTGRL